MHMAYDPYRRSLPRSVPLDTALKLRDQAQAALAAEEEARAAYQQLRRRYDSVQVEVDALRHQVSEGRAAREQLDRAREQLVVAREQLAAREAEVDALRAELSEVAPPAEPEVPVAPGGPGRGPIVVESVPAGAEVWLWVGTTPEMKLSNVEAGKDYEFKVLKDGMLPAYVAVKSADWYLSGESGPVHPSLHREVKLEPVPEPGAKGADGEGAKDSGKKKRRSRRKGKRRSR